MPRRPDLDRPEALLPLRPLDFSLLLVLAEGDNYGYGLAKAIGERDRGGIRLAPGNLYQVLDRLVDWGLVREVGRRVPAGASGKPRRHYAVTDFGLQVAALEAERLKAMQGAIDEFETSAPSVGR